LSISFLPTSIPESVYNGPTYICHPTLYFHRASYQLTWLPMLWVWHILDMIIPSGWRSANPKLYFASHFFPLNFQSLVYFKRKFNPSVSGSFVIIVTHQNLLLWGLLMLRKLMNTALWKHSS
jgi:hypothetical protein